jgi:hypothetical protein
MQKFLNLTLPLKQDAASQAGVKALKEALSTNDSPLKKQIDMVLTDYKKVHFARFLVIGTQYLQVITTYDGDENDYAKFFFDKLNSVFKAAYEFVEGAPTGANWTVDNFLAFNDKPENQPKPFFLYSAYPDKTVEMINGPM